MTLVGEEEQTKLAEQAELVKLAEMSAENRKLEVSQRLANEHDGTVAVAVNMADYLLGKANQNPDMKSLSAIYGEKVATKLVQATNTQERLSILMYSVNKYDEGEYDVLSRDWRGESLAADKNNLDRVVKNGQQAKERMDYKVAAKASLLECGLRMLENDESGPKELSLGGGAIGAAKAMDGWLAKDVTVVEPGWATKRLADALEKLSAHENDKVEDWLVKFGLPGVRESGYHVNISNAVSQRSVDLGRVCKTIESTGSRVFQREQLAKEVEVLNEWDGMVEKRGVEMVSGAFGRTREAVGELFNKHQYFSLSEGVAGERFAAGIHGRGLPFGPDANEYVTLCVDMVSGGEKTEKYLAENPYVSDIAGHDLEMFKKKMARESGLENVDEKWKDYIKGQIKMEAEGHLFGVLAVAVERNDRSLAVKVMEVLGQGKMAERVKNDSGVVDKTVEEEMKKVISREKMESFLKWVAEADKNVETKTQETARLQVAGEASRKENERQQLVAKENARVQEMAERFVNQSGRDMLARLTGTDVNEWGARLDSFTSAENDGEFAKALIDQLKVLMGRGGEKSEEIENRLFTRTDEKKDEIHGFLSFINIGEKWERHIGSVNVDLVAVKREMEEVEKELKEGQTIENRAKLEALKVLASMGSGKGVLPWNKAFPKK